MNNNVAENMRSAFGGESQARMRYQIWGEIAKKEGFSVVETVFNAISYAESIHAKSHFNVIKDVKGDFEVSSMAGFGIGSTSENLKAAADGEKWEVTVMYPEFLENAESADEKKAVNSIKWAMAAEQTHEKMYLEAKSFVDQGKDAEFSNIHICEVCGYAAHGDMEEKCPIWNVKSDKFRKF